MSGLATDIMRSQRLTVEALEHRTQLAADVVVDTAASVPQQRLPGDANKDGYFDQTDVIQLLPRDCDSLDGSKAMNEGSVNMKLQPSHIGVSRSGLLALVICLAAQANATALEIAYEQINGPAGDATASILIGEAGVEAGGGHINGQITALADGSDFFLFSQSALPGNSLARDANSPSAYTVSGLRLLDGDTQPVPSFLGEVWHSFFTIDGAPQPMSDPFELGLVFVPLPSDPSVMSTVVPYGAPPGASTDWSFSITTEVVFGGMGWTNSLSDSDAAIALGSSEIGVLDLVGLSAVKNDINGIHAGIALRPVPEPASAVLLLPAIGVAVVLRRRRSEEDASNHSQH